VKPGIINAKDSHIISVVAEYNGGLQGAKQRVFNIDRVSTHDNMVTCYNVAVGRNKKTTAAVTSWRNRLFIRARNVLHHSALRALDLFEIFPQLFIYRGLFGLQL